jgi:hypothetical protein
MTSATRSRKPPRACERSPTSGSLLQPLHRGLLEYKQHCSYRRLRSRALKRFLPRETIRSIKLYHRHVYGFAYHRPKLEFAGGTDDCFLSEHVFIDLAVLDDDQEVALQVRQRVDVGGGIARDEQHVRPGALLEDAELRLLVGVTRAAQGEEVAVA